MKSELPKVLVPVLGRPMLLYVLDALRAGGVERSVVVVGYRAELVQETLADRHDVTFALQAQQLGTGHAVMMCREALRDFDGPVLVVAGDSPMLRASSVDRLFREFEEYQPACLLGTATKPDPYGLGRIIRDAEGNFWGIVEEKDATAQQKGVTEVNLSCYVFQCRDLFAALEQLRPDNAQGEYYLTDCPRILRESGRPVRALNVLAPSESLSINSMEELAVVEAALRQEGAAR